MTPQDFDAFAGEFRRLVSALERFKQSPTEIAQRTDVYFQVLKGFPLSLVVQKADAWLERQTKFPKPAEWKHQQVRSRAEISLMTDAESREQLRAEKLGYEEDHPCDCAECVAAGLPDRAENRPRYVPLEDAEGHVLTAKNALSGTIGTPGRWLHGWDLRRLYEARAAFWTTAYEKLGVKPSKTLQPVIEALAGSTK